MALPKISLTMRTEGGVRQEELVVGAGSSIEIDLSENTGAAVGFDYTTPDALKLRLDGRLKLNVFDKSAAISGTVLRDMDTKKIEFNGTLELKIDKDIAATVTTSVNAHETVVGSKVKIAF